MALKYIRDNLKSLVWILWITIAALVALIFFDWGGFSQRATGGGNVAAVVGDETISFDELQNAYRNLENQYRQTFGEQFNDELARQLRLPIQALDQLINQRILLMEAREIGLVVTDGELREAIVSYPAFQRDGRFIGAEEYQQLLRNNRLSPDRFESSLREDLLVNKLYAILQKTAYVSDAELLEVYRDQNERAKIRYAELPASEMGEIEVAREELEAYLAENAGEYQISEKRVVDYLLIDTNRLRGEIVIGDDRLRAYYEGHQDEFQRREQARARHILRKVTPERPEDVARAELEDARRRLEAGEPFVDLARELSEDEATAASGGALPPFGRGGMPPAFEEAAFAAAVGEVVGPVRTTFGLDTAFTLIEVLGRTEAGTQTFEEVRARINARMMNDEVTRMAETKALDLADRIDADATEDDLRALAEEEGLSLETTEPFALDDPVTGLGRSVAFNEAVFDLAEGAVSDPVRIPRGWAVARLQRIEEPRDPLLEEVEDQVRAAVVRERQKEAAVARLEESLATGKTLDEVAAELGLKIKDPNEFGRKGSIPELPGSRGVVAAALALEIGARGGPIPTDNGAVVFDVTDRKKFKEQEFADARNSTRASQEQLKLQEMTQTIIQQRRRELVPQYTADVFSNFGLDAPETSG